MSGGPPLAVTSAKASEIDAASHLRLVATLMVLLWVCGMARAQSIDSYTIGPAPSWIIPPPMAPTNTPHKAETGQSIRLFDQQVHVPEKAYYRAYVREIHNESGVQDGSRINMYFDPIYQKLTLHRVAIRRGTNVLERLDREKIKVIQQERDLERHIYDGTVSVLLFLDDVRVGDLIEYAFTVHGTNPIFGERYATTFSTQWSIPVQSHRFRLLWPRARTLAHASYGKDLQPVIRDLADIKEYVWQDWDVPAFLHEDEVPSWFYDYPWVQVSEFASWGEVARWAATLYPRASALSEELKQKIATWKQPPLSPVEQVTAALNFVQQEVRYLGFEFGANSHRPSDPSAVCSRRFGDCKDKAYLLCSILTELGIEAVPALVNTDYHGRIQEWLPGPQAFDHVITQVKVAGNTLYLDPTISHQGGPATERYVPDYQACLLVRTDAAQLTTIPASTRGWPLTTITEEFRVGATNQTAEFNITTVYRGADADRVRSGFQESSRSEMEKEYLNYYGKYYPQIKASRSLETNDDPARNIFTTKEWYEIPGFWTLSDDQRTYTAEFHPAYVDGQLYKPSTQLRSMPLAVEHPRRIVHRTSVRLPEDWPKDRGGQTISSKAAVLREKHSCNRSKLVMEYEFETTTNSIPASHVSEYLQAIDRMEGALGYTLTWANAFAPAGQMNWSMLLAGGLFGVLASIGAVTIYRVRLTTPPIIHEPSLFDSRRVGIGGWLILVAFGLIASLVRVGVNFVSTWPSYSVESWSDLTTRGSESYHFLWGPYLCWALLANIATLILLMLMLILFFQRRRIFPRVYIGYLGFAALVALIELIAAQSLPDTDKNLTPVKDLVRVLITCSIWIPYMLVSRRVKFTFVR